jgi:hypothetical protein
VGYGADAKHPPSKKCTPSVSVKREEGAGGSECQGQGSQGIRFIVLLWVTVFTGTTCFRRVVY